jgi:hypothetical protein
MGGVVAADTIDAVKREQGVCALYRNRGGNREIKDIGGHVPGLPPLKGEVNPHRAIDRAGLARFQPGFNRD